MPHITNNSSNLTFLDIRKATKYLFLANLEINDINIYTALFMSYLNDNEDIKKIEYHNSAFKECRDELIKANSL